MTELAPVEQKTVVFYDDELTAVKLENGEIYVPVARLCDNLGLSWPGQRERINRDEVLSDAMMRLRVTRSLMAKGPQARDAQEMLCLPLKLIPGWLFGVNASRVKEEIREKLIRYRREAYDALWSAFRADIVPGLERELTAPSEALTPAERALALAEAVAAMARQQVAMERWLSYHDTRLATVEDAALEARDLAHTAQVRLDKAAEVVGEQAQRLRRIELTIAGGATVTDAQAAAISEAIKALAFQLGKAADPEAPRAGNPYQRVYSELYRKFRVPSYKALPLESFPIVMHWLTEWWQELTEESPPFALDN